MKYLAGTGMSTSRTDGRMYLTRDSAIDGTLSATIDLWTARPIRHRISLDGGYVWVPSGVSDWFAARALAVADATARYGAVPGADNVCMLLSAVTP